MNRLLNNAGGNVRQPAEQLTVDHWRQSLELMLGVGVCSGLGLAGSVWFGNSLLEMKEKALMSSHGMTEFFRRAHLRQIVEGDEFVQAMWGRVEPQLRCSGQVRHGQGDYRYSQGAVVLYDE